jgi:hypothetical protein
MGSSSNAFGPRFFLFFNLQFRVVVTEDLRISLPMSMEHYSKLNYSIYDFTGEGFLPYRQDKTDATKIELSIHTSLLAVVSA